MASLSVFWRIVRSRVCWQFAGDVESLEQRAVYCFGVLGISSCTVKPVLAKLLIGTRWLANVSYFDTCATKRMQTLLLTAICALLD